MEPHLISLSTEAGIFATFQSEGIELFYMLEGAVGHLHGMQIYPLKAGDALFFGVNAPHGPEILVRFPARYLWIISHVPGKWARPVHL